MKPILLIVGSNPSFSDPTGVLTEKSASGRRLKEWLKILDANGLYQVKCLNVSDGLGNAFVRKSNMELKRLREAHKEAQATIALGYIATRALRTFTADYLTMYHPSGKNRKLNDKQAVANKLNALSVVLSEKLQ